MNAEQLLTNTGINFPIDLSESQFMDAGRMLAKIEKGMQWAMGDWYNAIPKGDKKAACEKVGLNYKTAKDYASVCQQYPMSTRIDTLSFKHHRSATHSDINEGQRTQLLNQAVEHGWSARHLLDQRNQAQGLDKPKLKKQDIEPAKEAPTNEQANEICDEIANIVDPRHLMHLSEYQQRWAVKEYHELRELLAVLNKSMSKKAMTAYVRLLAYHKKVVDEYAYVNAPKNIKLLKLSLEKKAADLKALEQSLKKRAERLTKVLSDDDVKLIRGCLHPDRAPIERKKKFGKALAAFLKAVQ